METVQMWTGRRIAITMTGLAFSALAFGFIIFAAIVMRDAPADIEKADGIVVLTGGDNRIEAGARLLEKGRGKRLLISGVNARVSKEEVLKISGLSEATFACCVDLGYQALDTFGNADETRAWIESRHYSSLIVVTSSYHMPRSLAELSLALPGIALVAHPVKPPNFPSTSWWLHYRTTRLLMSEYLKFLPAAARLTTARLTGWIDSGTGREQTMKARADACLNTSAGRSC